MPNIQNNYFNKFTNRVSQAARYLYSITCITFGRESAESVAKAGMMGAHYMTAGPMLIANTSKYKNRSGHGYVTAA